jgi:NhaP-type Na+/H+ or K+/H+ antiporter
MTLNFSGITDVNALLIAAGVLLATYVIRFVFLKFFGGKSILPQLWIAPRGLITVLLFFSIPAQFIQTDFNPTILLVVILASSFIMTGGLMAKKEDFEEKEELVFDAWEALDEEVEAGINSPSKTL